MKMTAMCADKYSPSQVSRADIQYEVIEGNLHYYVIASCWKDSVRTVLMCGCSMLHFCGASYACKGDQCGMGRRCSGQIRKKDSWEIIWECFCGFALFWACLISWKLKYQVMEFDRFCFECTRLEQRGMLWGQSWGYGERREDG